MSVLKITFCCLLFIFLAPPLAAAEKTPNDVYHNVLLLIEEVKQLREKNHIYSPWPKVKKESDLGPQHVFQKAIEILEKINRYRENIAKTGSITVPDYPSREITPNEVYDLVLRLRAEIQLLTRSEVQDITTYDPGKRYTPSDVYARLSEVSVALDSTLGLRSISPSEVYQRSEQVLDMVKFIRRTQNITNKVKKPKKIEKQLPNHALAEVYQLLGKIRRSEKNLWLKPIKPYTLPRRVITPGDVYDAMGITLAELKRIIYRLGFEYDFKVIPSQKGKKPEDVSQNAKWARLLLPEFNFDKTLRQLNKSNLQKRSSHVFAITDKIFTKLRAYSRYRGIHANIPIPDKIDGIQPAHVYRKTLSLIDKVNVLRRQNNMGAITVPEYPSRKITPAEVYNLVNRLDKELMLVYKNEGLENIPVEDKDFALYQNKQPQDVYQNMERIESGLDKILGDFAYSITEVYHEAYIAYKELLLLAKLRLLPDNKSNSDHDKNRNQEVSLETLYQRTNNILQLLKDIKKRAGFFGSNLKKQSLKTISTSDVFDRISLIHAELISLKVFLGVESQVRAEPTSSSKTTEDIDYMLSRLEHLLNEILHRTHRQ